MVLLHAGGDYGDKRQYLLLTALISATAITYGLGRGGLSTVFGVLTVLAAVMMYG